MGIHRFRRGMILLTISTLFLAACAGVSTPATESEAEVEAGNSQMTQGGRIIIAAFEDAKGFNPLAWAHGIHWDIMPQMYNSLFWINADLQPEPRLVEDYTISDDGLTYTLNLRQGVKWHDGEEFTAEDVEFTILAWLNPAVPHPMKNQVSILAGATELMEGASIEELEAQPVEVIDTHTIQLNLSAPTSALLNSLGEQYAAIVPEHILGELPPEEWVASTLIENPVGTGPFRFVNASPGTIELAAFEEYYLGRACLDEVVFRTIPETAVQATELQAGTVDYIRYPPESTYQLLRDDPNIATLEGVDTLTWRNFTVNFQNPILQDSRLRQALLHALDREQIVQNLFRGNGVPAIEPMAPGVAWHNPDVQIYPFDMERATELLAEAGWSAGADGILEKEGERFEIVILTTTVEDWTQVAVYAQEQFRQLGVEASVEAMDTAAWVQAFQAGEFDLAFASTSMGTDPAPALYSQFHSEVAVNGYSNPDVDRLTDLLRTSVNEQERLDAMMELMEILANDLPHLWIYHPVRFYAFDAQLEGFQFNPKSTHVITYLWQVCWTE